MSFRLTGKQFFLTYPRCTLALSEARNLLAGILEWTHLIIAKELHEDGTPHLHVYVKCTRKLNIKSPKHFDLKEYHGNYQTVNNTAATINYVKKDNEFLEENKQITETVLDACKSMEPEEFFEYCVKNKIPKGYYDEAKKLCSRTFDILNSDEQLPEGNSTNLTLTLTR